jgi:hypothetical protein
MAKLSAIWLVPVFSRKHGKTKETDPFLTRRKPKRREELKRFTVRWVSARGVAGQSAGAIKTGGFFQ